MAEHDVRMHHCPGCGKDWRCLADGGPQSRRGYATRPVLSCVYDSQLVCTKCVREEEPSEAPPPGA